ncbi:MAG: MFS transporter, partial [Comamonadaceae bacterium]
MTAGLLRFIAGQVLLHGCLTGTRLAASLLALRDGHSAAAVGVLLALFAVSQIVLALPAGRLADRHGLMLPVRCSVAAAVLGAASAALMPTFAVLCAAALATGAATVTALVAIQRHVGRAVTGPVQLRQVFGWLSIGTAASNFIGPFAAGLLVDHAGPQAGSGAGYRAAFALMAVFPLACWALLRGTAELPNAGRDAGGARRSALDLLREPTFRRLILVNCFLQGCWDVHTFVVPVLGVERGIGASLIGTILGGFAVAAALVRVVLPLVAAHVREWAVLAGAMLAAAAIFGLYPLTTSALGMGVCSVLLGLALGMVQPMVMSMLHQITPAQRHGEAIGLRLMAINASSVAMPLLFGSAGAVIGIGGVFW